MRVISVGKVWPDETPLDDTALFADSTWEEDSELGHVANPQMEAIRWETASAYGFVAQVEPDEIVTVNSIAYRTPDDQLEATSQLELLEPGLIGFFLHGFNPGDPILFNNTEIPTPPPGPLDDRISRYVSPSAQTHQARTQSWACLKCGWAEHKTGELWGQGGGFAAFLDWENTAYHVVYCTRCGFTELYKRW